MRFTPHRPALWRAALCLLTAMWSCFAVAAEEKEPLVRPEYRSLITPRLLPLLHSPEVHAELKLTQVQVHDLETWLPTVDGPWFRARILPPEESRKAVDQLESQTREWLRKNLSKTQLTRLTQLEWQALGTRALFRSDLAQAIRLTDKQLGTLRDIATATDEAQSQLKPGETEGENVDAVKLAAEKEQKGINSTLSREQRSNLGTQLGSQFDLTHLSRIYPLAPELVPVAKWHNSDPLTLQSLRGKVVLIHFYAFQCHNCQANFPIYRRWQKQLLDKDVVLIGIQTPETNTERDPKAVCKAADQNDLKFPILLDMESKNWQAWGNTMWPTVYVIDKQGYIRHWWQGELNWQGATGDKTIEEIVDKCLAEPESDS